ncbi:MAG: acetyltransferase [Armatimonadetes bacterium]|nr:acetyltransferase [Armatimonadota bacterium]
MKGNPWGSWVISFIALFTAVSPYLADWNATHIYNPYWPPHAKFHNGQTMAFGAMAGVIALYYLWRRKADYQTKIYDLQVGTLFAALYWLTQVPAILFPGADYFDPQYGGNAKMPINQTQLDFVIFVILGVAYYAQAKNLGRTQTENPVSDLAQ